VLIYILSLGIAKEVQHIHFKSEVVVGLHQDAVLIDLDDKISLNCPQEKTEGQILQKHNIWRVGQLFSLIVGQQTHERIPSAYRSLIEACCQEEEEMRPDAARIVQSMEAMESAFTESTLADEYAILKEIAKTAEKLCFEDVSWERVERLMGYVDGILARYPQLSTDMRTAPIYKDLWVCGLYFSRLLIEKGDCKKAKVYLKLCIELSVEVNPTDNEKAWLSLCLGKIDVWDRNYVRANDHFHKAIDLFLECDVLIVAKCLLSLPVKSAKVLETVFRNLNEAYTAIRNPLPIQAMWEEKNTLGLHQGAPSADRFEYAEWERVLGNVKEALGLQNEAEEHYKLAIRLYRLRAERHPHIPLSYLHLARLETAKKGVQSTELLDAYIVRYEEILALYRAIFEDRHVLVAEGLFTIALIHEKCGRVNQARDFYNKAAKIFCEMLGDQSISLAECYESIVKLDFSQQNYDSALEFCKLALDIYFQLSNCTAREIACRYMLANLLFLTYKLSGADQQYQQIIDLHSKMGKVPTEVQRKIPGCFYNRALIQQHLGDPTTAHASFKEALKFYRESRNGRGQLRCLMKLAALLETKGVKTFYHEAKPLFKMFRDEPDFRMVTSEMGFMAQRAGQKQDAKAFLQEALDDLLILPEVNREKIAEIRKALDPINTHTM